MEHICIVYDSTKSSIDEMEYGTSQSVYTAVKALLLNKMFSDSKDEIALVCCGSDETNNSLYTDDSEAFQYISVVSELNKVTWKSLEKLDELNSSNFVKNADLLEAIYVAADHLVNKLKGSRTLGKKRIIVFSNLESEINFSQIDDIIEGSKNETIELTVVTNRDLSLVEGKGDLGHIKISEIRLNNEREMLKLTKETKGNCFSFQDAMTILSLFDGKSVTQRGWKVNLQVSNVFSISVVGYMKVKQVRPPVMKLVYGGDPDAPIEIKSSFNLSDPDNTAIEQDQIIKGFKYGKSVVPCTEEDIESMKLNVEKSLKLIGFTEEENVPHSLFVGDSSMFFVVDRDDHSAAFTSLVHAMYASGVVALVRRVYSKASSPRLAALIPRIKSDHVSLVYCELAFGEDIRSYQFPSFFGQLNSGTKKSSGNSIVLSEKQIASVDELIDKMMLVETSPDGKEKEKYKPSSIHNPSIQYLYQCVTFRCFHPNEKLPELNHDTMSILAPPEEQMQDIETVIESIKENFPLKSKSSVSKRKTAAEMFSQENSIIKQRRLDADDKTINLDELLGNKITEVGVVNPINDFVTMLKQEEHQVAVLNIESRIWQLINDSYLTTYYPQALLCLNELRNRSIEYSSDKLNLVRMFNDFLTDMKHDIPASKKDFWKLVVKEDINLISQNESQFSALDLEVDKFLLDDIPVIPEFDDDDDALFDNM